MLSATNDSVKSFHESFYGKPTMDEPRRRRGKKKHPVAKEEPHNEVAVVGTHYRSFDDDTMAAFVNSATALVPWNGDPKLLIDRYDVRHLLLDLTGIRRRRARPPSPDVTKEELDYERYRDVEGLENPDPAEDGQAMDGNDAGGYQRVGFDYGIGSDLSAAKERVEEALFTPPFFVPEHLRTSIPTSTKLHQIMAGTAKYVIEHGGQAEIVLRVKQANNSIFGFLMPDHPDHEYFRFLVAHPEHVGIAPDPQPVEEAPQEKLETSSEDTEGGLSLLGTAYGASDDDEGEDEGAKEEGGGSSLDQAQDQQAVVVQGDDPVIVDGATRESDGQQDTGDLPDAEMEASTQPTGAEIYQGASEAHDIEEPAPPGISEPVPDVNDTVARDAVTELPFKEPPVQLGRIIDKMVEFISRNGKEFEAIVRERDKTNHRFPFFLPWNEYHPYYSQKLKAAREAQTAGSEGGASDVSLVGESLDVKEHQVFRRDGEDSFLTGVPFWDESFVMDADDGAPATAIESGVSDPPPDDANQFQDGDGGMDFDAVLAAVRAATRGRPRGGESAEGEDLPKASEYVERPEIGSDEAVLAAIRTATGQANSPVPAGKGENTQGGERSDILPESAPRETTVTLTSHGSANLDVPDTLVDQGSQVDNVDEKQASPSTGGSIGLPDVELAPAEKRKAERLKKAKLFAAMIKDRNSSLASPAQQSVPLEILEPSTDRLSLTVMTSDTNSNANSPDKVLAASTEVEAEDRDLVGIGQPVDVEMQIDTEAGEELLSIEGKERREKEKYDKEQEEKHLKRLQKLKDTERRKDREYSSERQEKRNHDHYQDTRKKDRKRGRHRHEAHDEQAIDKVRNEREGKLKEKAGSMESEDDENYEEDRNRRDREHRRKRKDSKHRHGDEKSSRRNGHESSKSRRERKHGQELEKVRKESRHGRGSEEDDRKDGRYAQVHLQDVDAERREGRHRHAESEIIRDSTRSRHDSKERGSERYEEDDMEESRKERSRRHGKRNKHKGDNSDDSEERYIRRHERRSKKSRRRNDDPDERSGSHLPEAREDKTLGHVLEGTNSAGGLHKEKTPPSEKASLSSADIPDDIRAKVRAMLAMM